MNKMGLSRITLFLILGLVLTLAVISPVAVMAQGPAGETPTAEPGKPTATEPPSPTPTTILTPTPADATATVIPTRTPVPTEPVAIPEPITVILFGTGLAALSASAAVRRKKE